MKAMNIVGAQRSRLITAGAGTLLVLVMGAVLLAGFRLATQMRSGISALQSAGTLQTLPDEIARQLGALRDRLEARAYAGQALADLRATVKQFDTRIGQLAASDAARSPELEQALGLWQQYGPVLDPVINFAGQPYVDSDESGSTLSREGKAHFADVKRAQLFAAENSRRLQKQLDGLAATLQGKASAGADRLRLLLSAGVLAALVLAAAAAWLQIARSRVESAAREAQDQTRDILKTVREGFFLLDTDYRIGSVWSEALARIFGRNDFAGLSFEELLQDLVPDATLTTAMKYIKLLWGDRAHENLMKSINPLSQLEIRVDGETRYLQFDFHRVMGARGVKQVLCSVVDVTSSVLLARELQESQENASAQLDMVLGLMHVDPLQLTAFLDATDTGLQIVNAILKEPARSDAEFRKKLAGLFREMHSIKGEASALNLMSIAQRVHSLEDLVSELKKKAELSGNDFLPLVVKLDELMAHLRGVRDMATRLTALRDAPPAAATPARGPARERSLAPAPAAAAREAAPAPQSAPGVPPAPDLAPVLHSLAERLAKDNRKRFRLALSGLQDIPESYLPTLRDCMIQMLRNAAVHGIEEGEVRRAHTKDEVGTVKVDFRKCAEGFELVFEDDGAGLSPETLRAAALRRQIITEEEARSMDARAIMALIFRPGFSTRDQVSLDAGRGVGMDVVARNVYGMGGRIGVSTNPGRFTRFRIVLPQATAADTAVA